MAPPQMARQLYEEELLRRLLGVHGEGEGLSQRSEELRPRRLVCNDTTMCPRNRDATIGVFTQMTRSQTFDARPGMDWTIFLMLSIGHHIKLDARVSKNLMPTNPDAALPV